VARETNSGRQTEIDGVFPKTLGGKYFFLKKKEIFSKMKKKVTKNLRKKSKRNIQKK